MPVCGKGYLSDALNLRTLGDSCCPLGDHVISPRARRTSLHLEFQLPSQALQSTKERNTTNTQRQHFLHTLAPGSRQTCAIRCNVGRSSQMPLWHKLTANSKHHNKRGRIGAPCLASQKDTRWRTHNNTIPKPRGLQQSRYSIIQHNTT